MTLVIPEWLDHLRVDARGLPVPYVNRWGGEDVSRLRIDRDPWCGGAQAVFMDDDGELEPDFTAQNMGRQREVVARGLCQVCARPVPWSRRWLVVSSMSVETIVVRGRRLVVVGEPWLCERCARFATETCPALIRRRREDDLLLVRVEERDCLLTVSTGVVDGPLHDLSVEVQPIMWAKIAIARCAEEVEVPRC